MATLILLLKAYYGYFHFYQSNILALYLYFYSSLNLWYFLQHCICVGNFNQFVFFQSLKKELL